MGSVHAVRYEAERRAAWDDFVARSKNGVFLFQRGYVEYHADRFPDHSLMFYDDLGQLVALLPATEGGGVFSSHNGLTFGGIVSGAGMRVVLMLEVFEAACAYLRERGVEKFVYKAVPHIYHRLPAEEDLYALFRRDARLFRRDVATTIEFGEPVPSTRRRSAARLAAKFGVEVRGSQDFETFMAISEHVLKAKGTRPVHTAAEMRLLAERFPENIKLFGVFRGQEMLAGTIVYESPRVAHTQYIAVGDEGKKISALDLIVDHLLNHYGAGKRFLDFGISTEEGGRVLNASLCENKESFGGRAVAYDFYELDTRERPAAI